MPRADKQGACNASYTPQWPEHSSANPGNSYDLRGTDGTTVAVFTLFEHLKIDPSLTKDQAVAQGQTVGTIDLLSDGTVQGSGSAHVKPHLHWSVHVGSVTNASLELTSWLKGHGVATLLDLQGRGSGGQQGGIGAITEADLGVLKAPHDPISVTGSTRYTFKIDNTAMVNIWLEGNQNANLHLSGANLPVCFSIPRLGRSPPTLPSPSRVVRFGN